MATNDYLRTSSLDVEGNLNFRRLDEKKSYNKWLLGDALRSELGHDEDDGNTYSTPPEWVQSRSGANHAFVVTALSSSEHEVLHLNAYTSGTVQLESTAVPASGTEYYSKQSRFNTKTYSVTASADLNSADGFKRLDYLVSGLGNLISGSSGLPAIIPIDIPDYGKITNIRVWVEIVHSGSTSGFLGYLRLGLKSPNVSGFFSYPWLNGYGKPEELSVENPTTGSYPTKGLFNEFILHDNQWGTDSGASVFGPWYFDKSIRTIFDDASPQRNMHHLDPLYRSGSTDHQMYLTREGSPSRFFSSSILGYNNATGQGSIDSWEGANAPWITDNRLVGDAAYFNSSSNKSPPEGWLTGLGGVANDNEFATTGSNLGPATTKPIFSLLDEITQSQIVLFTGKPNSEIIIGKRPGLRGTEMHGRWELTVETGIPYDEFPTDGKNKQMYFRQVRLEITSEKNIDSNYRNGRIQKLRNSSTKKKGEKTTITFMSSTISDIISDHGLSIEIDEFALSETSAEAPYSPYRTFGITSNTGSTSDFAVFARITGSLSDRLTASLGFHHAFLNNEFGTPYIPLSSGSGESMTFISPASSNNKALISKIFEPKTLVSKATTLKSGLTKFNTTRTTRDLMNDAVSKISGSA